MFGSGAGIYMMNKCTAPIGFFEEAAGLKRLGAVEQPVVVAAIPHLVWMILDFVLLDLYNINSSLH